MSSLSQVTNIFPVSVFVFGDCWYASRWFTHIKGTLCKAANDQDTFLCLSGGVFYYSEKKKLYACDFKNCCWPRIITSKIYIQITIRKWVIGQYFPLICFHIENFGLQSIIIMVGRILTGNKWWVPVRSERPDVKMFILGWRFCFERFSIKSRNVILFSSLLIWTYEWHSFEA